MAHRYRYKEESNSAFAELSADHTATPEQLFQWLNECEDVDRVEWETTKTSQGNIGKHHSQSNIKVFPKTVCAGSATQVLLEFEITCNARMSKQAALYVGLPGEARQGAGATAGLYTPSWTHADHGEESNGWLGAFLAFGSWGRWFRVLEQHSKTIRALRKLLHASCPPELLSCQLCLFFEDGFGRADTWA